MSKFKAELKEEAMFSIVAGIIIIIIWMAVGSAIVKEVKNTITITEDNPYYEGYKFLGLTKEQNGNELVGIIGIFLALSLMMNAFKVTKGEYESTEEEEKELPDDISEFERYYLDKKEKDLNLQEKELELRERQKKIQQRRISLAKGKA